MKDEDIAKLLAQLMPVQRGLMLRQDRARAYVPPRTGSLTAGMLIAAARKLTKGQP